MTARGYIPLVVDSYSTSLFNIINLDEEREMDFIFKCKSCSTEASIVGSGHPDYDYDWYCENINCKYNWPMTGSVDQDPPEWVEQVWSDHK